MTTRERIAPILHETYGKGGMVDSLADHLAEKIDSWPGAPPTRDVRGTREYMVAMVCWNWFSGGDTAGRVAEKIEAALGATA